MKAPPNKDDTAAKHVDKQTRSQMPMRGGLPSGGPLGGSRAGGLPPIRGDTTQAPPEISSWWFADTRGVKSVWAVAWTHKGQIQQVMYKED